MTASERSNLVCIVKYHYTRDLENSRYAGFKGLDCKVFRQQLEYFQKHFNVVCMEDVIAAWSGEAVLPEAPLLLTFDDGYADNYLYAFPVLKEFGIQGSFFIPGKTFAENALLDVNKIHYMLAVSTNANDIFKSLLLKLNFYRGGDWDFPSNHELLEKYAIPSRFDDRETVFVKRILQKGIPEELRHIISSELLAEYVGVDENILARELYMNREQIKVMHDDGMFIGVHGYDHYWLGELEERAMKKDIDRALTELDRFIDRKCWVINYPYGSFSENVISYVKAKGCKLGLATISGFASAGKDPYQIPRLDCTDFPPISDNWKKYIYEVKR